MKTFLLWLDKKIASEDILKCEAVKRYILYYRYELIDDDSSEEEINTLFRKYTDNLYLQQSINSFLDSMYCGESYVMCGEDDIDLPALCVVKYLSVEQPEMLITKFEKDEQLSKMSGIINIYPQKDNLFEFISTTVSK